MPLPLLALAAQLVPYLLPKVAKALGGDKAEKVAETVVGIAEAVTGKKGSDAVEAVKANPETALAYLKAQMDQEWRLEELVVDDRKDARLRDRAFIAMGKWNFRADLMVMGCVVALCYIVNEIAGTEIKPEVLAIFNMAVGALLKMLGDAFAFEFGSSRGSKEKDEALKRLG
jgi:hypothetical protein